MTSTTTDADVRYPLSELRYILTTLMKDRGYLAEGPCMRRDETGWRPPDPLPPDQGLRLSDFLDAIAPLPDPAPESAAAEAVLGVFIERGHRFLLPELAGLCEERWPSADPGGGQQAAKGMRCQVCAKPLAPGSRANRRTCSDSCRQSLRRRRAQAKR